MEIGLSTSGGFMKRKALVCILSAASGVNSSCGTTLTASELRSMDVIGPPNVSAEAPSESLIKKKYFETSPLRLTSCLEFGRTHFKDLRARAEVGFLELDGMDCEECHAHISIDIPPPALSAIRVRYVFGYLTLSHASDGVIQKLPTVCSESWHKASSHAPLCYWERTSPDVRRSGIFAVRMLGTEASIATLDLRIKIPSNVDKEYEQLPKFAEWITIEPDIAGGSIVSLLFDLSGRVGFVPTAVEAVSATDGKPLGCLPVAS